MNFLAQKEVPKAAVHIYMIEVGQIKNLKSYHARVSTKNVDKEID